jgi:adenylate kinase
MNKNKKIIIFFGPPGSGKGTQADMLASDLKIAVISPGELLRHEVDNKTKVGLAVEKKLAKGKLVPNKLIEHMLDNRLAKHDTLKGFVLDGYPRCIKQLVFFKKRLKKLIRNEKAIAIYIDVSDKEVKRRISGRRVCDCGASYHLLYNPPKIKGICDLCHKKITQRPDDKLSVLKNRLHDFHETIKPLLDYFKKYHIFIKIDGCQTIEEIKKELSNLISNNIS